MDLKATHTVSFSGCPGGIYPTTWAQAEVSRVADAIGDDPREINARFDGPVIGSPAIAEILTGIRLVIEGYEALRTHYVMNSDGLWDQHVATDGHVRVPVYDTAAENLDVTATDVVSALTSNPFEEGEPSVRVSIILADGMPAKIVIVARHMSADGIALEIIHDGIIRLSLNPRAETASAWQPHEIAHFEHGPEGRLHAAHSAARLREQLRRVAAAEPPARISSGLPEGFVGVQLKSQAVAAATLRLAERIGISGGMVLLGAYAVVLSRRLKQDVSAFHLACSNRWNAQMRMSVAQLSQSVPILVDSATADFAEICRRAGAASLHAYRCGHHDMRLLDAATRDIENQYGRSINVPYSANLRIVGPSDLGHGMQDTSRSGMARYGGLSGGEIRALTSSEIMDEWSLIGINPPQPDLGFAAWALSDVAVLWLGANSACFKLEELKEMVRRMESVMIDAACEYADASCRAH